MEQHISTVDGSITPGKAVYTRAGQLMGHISRTTENGFEVETNGIDHAELSVHMSGERYLMWKCWECGEMGALKQSIPANCPSCDASREAISEVLED
jgi:rubrerythrin